MEDIFEGWGEEEQTNSATSNNHTSNSSDTDTGRRQDENNRVHDEPIHHDFDLGEAPDFPSIFFTYDDKTQVLEIRDRRGKIKQQVPVITVKGTNGEGAYETWKKGKKGTEDISIEAFLESMQGKIGKNGKNAYEEWKDSRDPNTDRSWDAYLKFFTGDKGESAFEQWKKVHGEYSNPTIDDFFNYFKGQNGKDAYQVWQDMGFKDRSREDFFKWIASLVETQRGEDGKIYYPHFDGYVIYFTEDVQGRGPRFIEKDIRGKDGRTFDPVFDGTKLHFEDGEGVSTNPVELKGKDAFELWKEYHHKPDAKYEEFEDYFKGQNIQSPHTYMEVKDWRCPVQTIDTDLIVNSLRPAKSPQSFIKERQNAIKDLRGKGNELEDYTNRFGRKKHRHKRRANWFKEFTWWCAGADKGLLRMCPGDHSKYVGIGTVILFTALMAWFSSFIAIQLVFDPIHIQLKECGDFWKAFGYNFEGKYYLDLPLAAILFASFWSAMIFFLDRFITNTMYSDGEVTISRKEFFSGLPRILIAIFLGIVISAPLELKIFKEEIDAHLAQKIRSENINRIKNDPDYLQSEILLSLAKQQYESKQTASDKFNDTNNADSTFYITKQQVQSKTDATTNTTTNPATAETVTTTSGGSSSYTYDKEFSPLLWNTAKKDAQDTAKAYERQYLCRLDSLDILEKSLSDRYNSDTLVQRLVKDKGLYDRLTALHSIAMKVGEEGGYAPLFPPKTFGDTISVKEYTQVIGAVIDSAAIQTDRVMSRNESANISVPLDHKNWPDIIMKIIISLICTGIFVLIALKQNKEEKNGLRLTIRISLSVIFGFLIGCNYELIHYLLYYLTTPIGLIMLLFILIDISPVLYKMMLADGVYDKYLQQEKSLAEDKIRLNNAQMLRQIEKSELKSVSPFIMGDIYDELRKTAIDKPDKEHSDVQSDCSQECDTKKHIVWEDGDSSYNLEGDIEKYNKEVFDKVLEYKKRIVLASYAAWYRDMRDSMIGKKDDPAGDEINPENAFKGDDWA